MDTQPAAPPRSIKTPCVLICVLDDRSGLCFGCYRTGDEIAGWAAMTDLERAAIMDQLATRAGSGQMESFDPS